MVYEKTTIKMSDGNGNVFHQWTPDSSGDVRAVVLVSHGMAEYAGRYENFASVLCSQGIALFAEDHRGHGETAELAEKNGSGAFGYLADRQGFLRVVEDIHEEILLMRERFPGKKVVLFGHSFGSFVSQCVIEKYGGLLDGCILCGTAGPRPLTIGFGKLFSSLLCALGFSRRKAGLLDKLSFGSYNAKIKNPRTGFDWLSRDGEQVDLYIKHPWCGFVCTGEFYRELTSGLSLIHRRSMIRNVPQNLPVLFIAGTADPVGSYCKTIRNLISSYKKNGVKDLESIFYEGARHELLNETNRNEVHRDVLNWIGGRFFA